MAAAIDEGDQDWTRAIRLFRIAQMFRMTYKYKAMRQVLAKAFKTASSVMWLVMFVVFLLCIFSVIGTRPIWQHAQEHTRTKANLLLQHVNTFGCHFHQV